MLFERDATTAPATAGAVVTAQFRPQNCTIRRARVSTFMSCEFLEIKSVENHKEPDKRVLKTVEKFSEGRLRGLKYDSYIRRPYLPLSTKLLLSKTKEICNKKTRLAHDYRDLVTQLIVSGLERNLTII